MHFNPMLIPTAILALVLCVASYRLAARASRPRQAVPLIAVSLLAAFPALLMALYYAHRYDSWRLFYEFRAFPLSELAAAGLGLPAGLALRCTRSFGRLRVLAWPGLLLIMLLVVLVPYLKPMITPANYDAFRDRWDGRVCRQSTGSSCGAASAATLLRLYGHDVTERDLARECYTSATGTESWYLARAFRRRGLHAHFITRPPLPDPLPAPCIAGVRLGVIGHFIAILEDRGDTVVTADPLEGEREYPKSALNRKFNFTGFILSAK